MITNFISNYLDFLDFIDLLICEKMLWLFLHAQ